MERSPKSLRSFEHPTRLRPTDDPEDLMAEVAAVIAELTLEPTSAKTPPTLAAGSAGDGAGVEATGAASFPAA